jgi:UDP-N-acetylmuramoylalanine-D-glutamate ligase
MSDNTLCFQLIYLTVFLWKDKTNTEQSMQFAQIEQVQDNALYVNNSPITEWHINGAYFCKAIFLSYHFGAKLGKVRANLAFIPEFTPHTHKLSILRHRTNIVYISDKKDVIYGSV